MFNSSFEKKTILINDTAITLKVLDNKFLTFRLKRQF
jgi:hypothetical protein